MNSFKGTPWPWVIIPASSNIIEIENENVRICEIVAENDEDLLTELEWDNARLIATAPDLLSALQNLVYLHSCEQEGIESGKPSPDQWILAVNRASVVIQKALGNGGLEPS